MVTRLVALSQGNGLIPGQSEPRNQLIELRNRIQGDPLNLALRGKRGGRYNRPGKAELGGFFEPLIGVSDGADSAGEAHLAEIDPILGDRTARKRGEQGGGGGEICGGFGKAQSAGDVQIDIVAAT